MIVTLDLPSHLAGRVEADARANGQPIADFLRDAVAGLYEPEEADNLEDLDGLPADIYKTHPLPASLTEPLAETARKVNAAIEAGDIIDGETFLAEMRRLAGRE